MSKEDELYKIANDGKKSDGTRKQALDGLGKLDTDKAHERLGSLAKDGSKPDWLRKQAVDKLSKK